MIWGSGIDIVDIEEFKRLLNLSGENFLNLIFTKKEKGKANSEQAIKNLSGIFSAKEAIFKSLNLSRAKIKNFNYFKEIEIIHLSSGKPEVKFLGSLAKKFPKQKFKVFVSISYSSNLASTMAIIEKVQ